MEILDLIKGRRSIRSFTKQQVDDSLIDKILESGRWAPSGRNNQPWKFLVVTDEGTKKKLAGCTHYGAIIEGSPVCIAVFLDNDESYDRTKDTQAIGACIQNMLLEIHSLSLGAVWLGEILNKRGEVEKILRVPKSCELMAIIALGHPRSKGTSSARKSTVELIV